MPQSEPTSLDPPSDVAERFNVKERTLADWRRRSFGPRWLKLGKKILYDRADVDRWIVERKNASTAPFSEAR